MSDPTSLETHAKTNERLKLIMSKEAYKALVKLAAIEDKEIYEVIRDALDLEKFVLETQLDGGQVVFHDKDGTKKVLTSRRNK